MPETKDKTLEEIDIIFSQPMSQLVKENFRSAMVTAGDFWAFRWGKVSIPVLNAAFEVDFELTVIIDDGNAKAGTRND